MWSCPWSGYISLRKKNHSILTDSSMLLKSILAQFSWKYFVVAYLTEKFAWDITEWYSLDIKKDGFFNYLTSYWVHVSFKNQNTTFNVTNLLCIQMMKW